LPVPFHVEIKSGLQHARAFNLEEGNVRRAIVEPWLDGREIELGGREWEPKECTLRILEGPELSGPDLALGRGWDNAQRHSENVTRRLVTREASPAGPAVAVLAESAEAEGQLQQMLATLELERADWAELRARILSPAAAQGGGPKLYAAVLIVESTEPASSWMFDAGLARGALGHRAVLVQLGNGAIPAELAGVDVIRVVPEDETSLRALRERLSG
jgi:hypothetical protein